MFKINRVEGPNQMIEILIRWIYLHQFFLFNKERTLHGGKTSAMVFFVKVIFQNYHLRFKSYHL